jgi:probable rRNA maturation factor
VPSINFFTEDTSFKLTNRSVYKNWIKTVIVDYGFVPGEISYVFCSDNYLLSINIEHLKHNTYTDIITFNYNEEDRISSDIFISIDRVKENASKFHITFAEELARVMIHGVLHLIGFNDKTEDEKQKMRLQEDNSLEKLKAMFHVEQKPFK